MKFSRIHSSIFVWVLALLPVAASTNSPFVVTGRILDHRGRPLAEVEIRAACGWGTLMPTGKTTTDENGAVQLAGGSVNRPFAPLSLGTVS